MPRQEAGYIESVCMIIVVVGLPGSGKSTAAQLLKEEGFQVIELGDIWRGLLREYKIPRDDPKATREFTLWIRKKEGKDIYAKRAVKLIKKSMSNIVIMGVRSTYEMDYLKRRIKEMKVAARSKELASLYRSRLGADGFNTMQSSGKEAGQSVMHYHMHLVPRYKDDGLSLWLHRNADKRIDIQEAFDRIKGR